MGQFTHKNQGFTLIELSVVIVIIGLIVAGVVAGQSLVKQASLRSVVSEFNSYDTALRSFRLVYDALPGDMVNANDYWSGCDISLTTDQCNGDGDGIINFVNGTSDVNETYVAWVHLSNAGLIDGTFTGVYEDHTDMIGKNVPASSIKGAAYAFVNGTLTGWTGADDVTNVNNHIRLAAPRDLGSNDRITLDAFAPAESSSLDVKMDDGIPGRGILVMHGNAISNGCVTSSDVFTSTYDFSESGDVCMPQYRFDYIK